MPASTEGVHFSYHLFLIMFLIATLPEGNRVHTNEVLSGVSIAEKQCMHPTMNGEVLALLTSLFLTT